MTCERNEISLLEASELLNRGITPSYTEDLVNGVLVLNQKCIRDQKVSFEQARLTDKNKKKINHEKYLLDYDILINSTGVGTLGRVAQIKRVNQPTTVDSHVTILRPNPTIVNPEYLGYVVKNIQPVIESMAEGTTGQTELSRERVGKIKFDLPTQPYQIKVVKILSTIDKRIDLLKETNKTLESIAEAIFKSWFVDFDPVHAKQQGKECAGIDKVTADLFPNSFVESKLGLIPKDWEVGVLGDLLTPKRGKTITKSACIAGDVPVVAGGLEPAYFHNKSNVKGPVITISASGANAGFVRLYQEDVWASDCTYISSEQTDEIFFWYMFLKYNQEKIYFMQQGAAQPHIYASDLMRLNVCFLKNNALQSIFNTFIAPIFKRIGRANRQIDILSNLRDTLLPRLISGKLDLSNIEEQLEGIA